MSAALTPAQGRALAAYFDALARGEAGMAAAASLGIAWPTLRNNVNAAYRGLGVTNVVQAAIALGLMRWDAGTSEAGMIAVQDARRPIVPVPA
jgi:hypothetical protein